MPAPDWKTKASEIALIREACREGEAKLAAQVTIATSSDQRATILAGIYVAAATGTIGALLTKTAEGGIPLVVGAVVTAAAFLGGALLCLRATLPAVFWTPGNDPSEWYADIENAVPEHVALGQQSANYDKHIKINEETLQRNSRQFGRGAKLGIAAPIMGLLAAGLISLLLCATSGRL